MSVDKSQRLNVIGEVEMIVFRIYVHRCSKRAVSLRQENKRRHLPDDDVSCGTIILVVRVILAVSVNVSRHERMAATAELGAGLEGGSFVTARLFNVVDDVSRVGVRRRKLTRLRND